MAKSMTKRQRAWRLHQQGCTPAQIAEMLNTRRETVNVMLSQTRAEFRKQITNPKTMEAA